MFEVYLSNNAKRFLDRSEIKDRIIHAINVLETSPVPAKHFDVAKIAGREGTYRIRISNVRIIYRVYWRDRIIHVLKIDTRDETTYL